MTQKGDVPELDTRKVLSYQALKGCQNRPGTGDFSAEIPIFQAARKSRFRRLIGVVLAVFVLAGVNRVDAQIDLSGHVVAVTEIGEARLSKPVQVSDQTPHIKKPIPLAHAFLEALNLATRYVSTTFQSECTGGDHHASAFQFFLIYREPFQSWVATKLPIDDPTDSLSRQPSDVSDFDFYIHLVRSVFVWFGPEWFYAQVGALQNSTVFPLDVSNNTEGKSRDYQKPSEDIRQGAFLPGWFLFGCLLGLGIVVCIVKWL